MSGYDARVREAVARLERGPDYRSLVHAANQILEGSNLAEEFQEHIRRLIERSGILPPEGTPITPQRRQQLYGQLQQFISSKPLINQDMHSQSLQKLIGDREFMEHVETEVKKHMDAMPLNAPPTYERSSREGEREYGRRRSGDFDRFNDPRSDRISYKRPRDY